MGGKMSRRVPYRIPLRKELSDELARTGLVKRLVITLPEGREHEINFDDSDNCDMWFWHAKRSRGTKFDKTTSEFVCTGVIDLEEWMERACGIYFAEDASCGTEIGNRTCDYFFSSTEAKDVFASNHLVLVPRLVCMVTISVDEQIEGM
jgi:hypothetical protein